MIQKIEVNLSESILFGLSNVYKTGGMVKISQFNIISDTESLMMVRRNLKNFVEPVLFDVFWMEMNGGVYDSWDF